MSDFDNMDLYFRENLGAMKIEPKNETWNRISYKLLWRELARFNFTNLNAGYFGIGGAAIIGISVLLYTIFTTSVQNVNSQQNVPEVRNPNKTELNQHYPINSFQSIDGSNQIAASDKIPTDENDDSDIIHKRDQVVTGFGDWKTENRPDSKGKGKSENSNTENFLAESTAEMNSENDVNQPNPENLSKSEKPAVANTQSASIDLPDFNSISASEIISDNSVLGLSAGIEKPVSYKEDIIIQNQVSSGNVESVGSQNRKTQSISKVKSINISVLKRSSDKTIKSKFSTGVPGKKRYGVESFFSSSVYLSTELMDYKIENKDPSWVYLAGATIDYNILDFIFQIGGEFSVTEDIGNYNVEYKSLDSTGFYWQPSGDSLIAVPVYDSVLHSENPQITNRYTYFSIPITFGYRFYGVNRFVGIAKGGVTFSTLINKVEPELTYFKEDVSIQNIENETYSRYSTNFQIFLGLQLRYLYSEKIDIFVESSYRKYLQSVYDNEAVTTQPYTIGLKGGIVIKF